MADFTLKRGDTKPALAVQLTDTVGAVTTPIDLTAATTVKLIMRNQSAPPGSSPAVNSACSFVDRAQGRISYQWGPANTSSAGLFNTEFQITWNDGGIETVPNDAIPANNGLPYYVIEIKEDLGD